MKNVLNRISAVLCSLTLLTAFASCGKSDSDEEKKTNNNMVGGDIDDDVNVGVDDMPYGSTMRSMRPAADNDVPLMVEFDYRFVTEDMAYAVSNYMAGVAKKDPALMQKATNPEIFKAAMESEEAATPEEYAEAMYNDIKEVVGDDFTLSMISVQSVSDSSSFNFASYNMFVNSVLPDAQITDRKLLELNVYYKTDDSSGTLYAKTGAYVNAVLYTIDGKLYIIG